MKFLAVLIFACVQSFASLKAGNTTSVVGGDAAPHSHQETVSLDPHHEHALEHDEDHDVSHNENVDLEHTHTHRHSPDEPEHSHSHHHVSFATGSIAIINQPSSLSFALTESSLSYHQYDPNAVIEPVLGSLFRPPISVILS